MKSLENMGVLENVQPLGCAPCFLYNSDGENPGCKGIIGAEELA